MKRYVATIDMYVYAESDEQAKAKADKIAMTLYNDDDCKAAVTEIGEQPFGTMEYRKITK